MTLEQMGAALGILSEVAPRSALALNMYIAELELERDREATRADKAERERDAAVADNARHIQRLENTVASLRKAVDEEKAKKRPSKARIMEWMHALVLFEQHLAMATENSPGVALLEQHRKEIDKWAENVSILRAERDTERQLRLEAAEQHRKALEPLRAVVDALSTEMERTIRHRESSGMSVPDHGDFAAAPPSMLGRLRWWSREMRESLGGNVSALLARARNEGLEKAASDAAEGGGDGLEIATRIRAMKETEP